MVELLDVLREVLEDFKGRLNIVDAESVLQRPSGGLGYLQDQFYIAYKKLSKQDERVLRIVEIRRPRAIV
ncbi:unnamed protein product [Bursaphelenchus okinawaensis]|uniref:Uncharacterized protein n=1 Tax=Bursaphelenchus okinawaensis TaxID=465554 RepID=A0A811JSA5_9BILA|nr:unnamed protein product [Bursaphelenchus okinawaensis]CAG9080224.1 unnamed protein product [Bursaphelenchus okinawaensis]